MRTIIPIIAFLFFLHAALPASSQNNNWPKTLLWKIERSDLKKPSFLFGTMHLQDKRLFNLGDSFYYHFERAEGFAIEVDFKEYMDSVMGRLFSTLEERELSDEEDFKISDKVDTTVAIIDTTIDIDLPPPTASIKTNKFTRKYFRKIRNERIKRLLVYGEMPTILDAYLYGMAMKQGKWLGAVEEVKDQLNLKDELGKDIDEEEMNQTEEKMMFTLENMITIYLDQDLNKIEEYALSKGNPRKKTILFNNRNTKMVQSIDSLSHSRSMFYAVGAAHLPGDSGIITLLKKEGYTVTPVYSTNKLAAEKYAEKLPALSWYQVGQTDSLYTIDMPGVPTEYNMFGELVKMKVLIDITTMTFYMTGHSIAQFDDTKLNEVLKDMATSMGGGRGKLENTRKFEQSGLKGIEGSVYNNGVYSKVQVLTNNNAVFFLMVGGSKKSVISTPESAKFFNSFRSNAHLQPAKPKDWAEFTMPDKAFTVSMPGKPKRNKAFEKQAENSGWSFAVYDYTDMTKGLYYLVQVRDIDPGLFLEGDSVFFTSFRDNLITEEVEKNNEEYSTEFGFSAMRLDATTAKDNLFYKTKSIVRGNRVYIMMVLGNLSKKNDHETETFFDSFRMLDYQPSDSETFTVDDNTFSTKAPAKFNFVKPDEDEEDDEEASRRKQYTSYNANEAISYEVLKEELSKYYWAENDSSFFRLKANNYKAYNDSILSYTNITNGNLRGIEQITQREGSSNLRKLRVLLHADTLYTLITYIPVPYINNKIHVDFFNQFRVKNDIVATTVFQNKAAKLLKALQEKDSATFTEAKNYLSEVSFTKNDLPLLHQALLYNYQDDSLNYGSVTNRLINILDDLSDSSTVDFVKNNYSKIDAAKEDNNAAMLNVLASYPTAYSYTLLKDLLMNQTPVKLIHRKSIGYQLDDSLALTKTLYPELLQLLKQPDYWQDITDYTAELLDSNMLTPDILKPYEKQLEYLADTLLHGTLIKEEDVWLWNYQNLLKLLGYNNTATANNLLQQYAAGKDLYLKQAAILSLLRNNQTVATAEIEKLAADKEMRISFYEELKEINKEQYFTPKYRTQRYFAETYVYNYGDEDYTPSSIEYIGEREVMFAGEKKRIFLFKLMYSNEEDPKDKETYLGIAGPFSLDAKILECTNDATEIFFDEEYDKKNLERQFKELLQRGEEYVRKKAKE